MKFNFGMSTGTGYVDLANVDFKKNGSLYVTPVPPYWGKTGFHVAFHPDSTWFKTYKPLNPIRVPGRGLSFVSDIRNYFRQNMMDLDVQDEPGLVCLSKLDDLSQHVKLQRKNITVNAASIMNSTGIVEVNNIKKTFYRLKQQPISSMTLMHTYGMNSGTISSTLNLPLINMKNGNGGNYTNGVTIKLNLYDLKYLRQLPFASPYIVPMTKIVETAKEFLPRNIDGGLSNLSELNPKMKLPLK